MYMSCIYVFLCACTVKHIYGKWMMVLYRVYRLYRLYRLYRCIVCITCIGDKEMPILAHRHSKAWNKCKPTMSQRYEENPTYQRCCTLIFVAIKRSVRVFGRPWLLTLLRRIYDGVTVRLHHSIIERNRVNLPCMRVDLPVRTNIRPWLFDGVTTVLRRLRDGVTFIRYSINFRSLLYWLRSQFFIPYTCGGLPGRLLRWLTL